MTPWCWAHQVQACVRLHWITCCLPASPLESHWPRTRLRAHYLLVFLGIELDTVLMEARLPADKLRRLCLELQEWAALKCWTAHPLLLRQHVSSCIPHQGLITRTIWDRHAPLLHSSPHPLGSSYTLSMWLAQTMALPTAFPAITCFIFLSGPTRLHTTCGLSWCWNSSTGYPRGGEHSSVLSSKRSCCLNSEMLPIWSAPILVLLSTSEPRSTACNRTHRSLVHFIFR